MENKFDLYYYKSLINLELNDYDNAIKNIKYCSKISPNDPASFYAEYLIYNKQGKNIKALSALEKAISRKLNS